MLITLRHKATGLDITIRTEGFDPDEPVIPIIESDNETLKETLLYDLNNASGVYGHLIDTQSTTNLDLATAARKLEYFDFDFIDQEIEPSQLPEEANT